MRSPYAALVVLLLGLPAVSAAQTRPEPGERVRVTRDDGASSVGTLSAWSADTLWLADEDGRIDAVPLALVEQLERSLGRDQRFARNFFLTAGIMALVGGTAGAILWSPCESTLWLGCLFHPDSRSDAFVLGMAIGGVVGVPVGVVVGLSRHYDRWALVEVDGERGLQVSPVLGPRPGIVLSWPTGRR